MRSFMPAQLYQGSHHKDLLYVGLLARPLPLWHSAQSPADKGGLEVKYQRDRRVRREYMCQVWYGRAGDRKEKGGPLGTSWVREFIVLIKINKK